MQVSADALLAPYIKVDVTNGVNTYYMLKTRGQGLVNAGWNLFNPLTTHNLHFRLIYKPLPAGISEQLTSCLESDLQGTVSAQDMVYGDLFSGGLNFDLSDPPAFFSTGYEGFMVIAEELTLVLATGLEGEFTGFAYVINAVGNEMVSYKMLNDINDANGTRDTSGLPAGVAGIGSDWTGPVVAKNVFDITWWPTNLVNVSWPTIVLGTNMFNSGIGNWAGSVRLQGAQDPTTGAPGIYNNDEKIVSNAIPKPIVCAGMVTLNELVAAGTLPSVANGGWTRLVAVPWADNYCNNAGVVCPVPPAPAWGRAALMQKIQTIPSIGKVGYAIETGAQIGAGLPAAGPFPPAGIAPAVPAGTIVNWPY